MMMTNTIINTITILLLLLCNNNNITNILINASGKKPDSLYPLIEIPCSALSHANGKTGKPNLSPSLLLNLPLPSGFKIKGIKDFYDKKDIEIFHSGTKNSKNSIVTNGGRVLSVTARSTKLKKARKKAYEIVRKLKWKKEYHRSDIAKKL